MKLRWALLLLLAAPFKGSAGDGEKEQVANDEGVTNALRAARHGCSGLVLGSLCGQLLP
jgi:hypothetical protein